MLLADHLPPGLRVPEKWDLGPAYYEETEADGEPCFRITKKGAIFHIRKQDEQYVEAVRAAIMQLIRGG